MSKKHQKVPIETKIYYSKLSLGVYWFLGVTVLSYGIYLSLDQDFFGYILVLLALYLIYYASRRSKLGKPVIVLNSKGIKTLNTAFISWEDVESIRTERRGTAKYAIWYLNLRFNSKSASGQSVEEIDISDLDTTATRIAELTKAYQTKQ